MDFDVRFDLEKNEAVLGESHLVFHCHYYNNTLQKVIEEGLGDDASALLTAAAQEAARMQLQTIAKERQGPEVLDAAKTLFCRAGFGTLDFSSVTARGGHVICPHSHYALGWLSHFGERETPVCEFVAGYVGASLIAAHHLLPERVVVKETECQAMGHAQCRFDVEVR